MLGEPTCLPEMSDTVDLAVRGSGMLSRRRLSCFFCFLTDVLRCLGAVLDFAPCSTAYVGVGSIVAP